MKISQLDNYLFSYTLEEWEVIRLDENPLLTPAEIEAEWNLLKPQSSDNLVDYPVGKDDSQKSHDQCDQNQEKCSPLSHIKNL